MQRGRDHGLPGYIFYREACGAGPIDSFEDFSNNMTPEVFQLIFINILEQLFRAHRFQLHQRFSRAFIVQIFGAKLHFSLAPKICAKKGAKNVDKIDCRFQFH